MGESPKDVVGDPEPPPVGETKPPEAVGTPEPSPSPGPIPTPVPSPTPKEVKDCLTYTGNISTAADLTTVPHGVCKIIGDVVFIGINFTDEDITKNLPKLNSLKYIEGTVGIIKTNLTNLHFFQNVLMIGKDLNLKGNTDLKTLDGLASLNVIQKSLYIIGNKSLDNIDALYGLKFVGAEAHDGSAAVIISGNQSLEETALNEFTEFLDTHLNLSSAGGTMEFYPNKAD
ncbi:MAG: hypothetical protein HYU97_03690 [Deltaproteobacteria bacterium]|nr:hypothetical protein [Deltaproteobacteria bacterium]